MRRLVATLPSPSPPPLTFHVAGTNGKGSVCACLDAIAREHGLKTGLFTSPHLVRFHERMRINGEPISDDELGAQLAFWQSALADWDPHPSFFEVTLALALSHFQQQQVECLVLETGLGGRLDATNAVEPRHVCVVTPIDYDHTEILGETLDQIAREKAGIFRPAVPVVSSPQKAEAAGALHDCTQALKAPLRWVEAPYSGPLALAGAHQRHNAAVAIAAFEASGHALSPAKVHRALKGMHWPGRFHRIPPHYVLDGAHNLASVQALVETWKQVLGERKATVVFGCAQGKRASQVLGELDAIAQRFVFTPITSPRSQDPAQLTALTSHPSTVATDCRDALRMAEGSETHPVLVTGSLFLIGEALAQLSGETRPRSTTQ